RFALRQAGVNGKVLTTFHEFLPFLSYRGRTHVAVFLRTRKGNRTLVYSHVDRGAAEGATAAVEQREFLEALARPYRGRKLRASHLSGRPAEIHRAGPKGEAGRDRRCA